MQHNFSFNSTANDCSNYSVNHVLGISIQLTRIVVLVPIYTLVFYLGLQQWRQHHSFSTASHFDIFTYNMAALQLIWVWASVISILSSFTGIPQTVEMFPFLFCIAWFGENFFHVLTCLERYLAVVHPITYMRLRKARGIRIRNISIVCVWVLTPLLSGLVYVNFHPQFLVSFLTPFGVCLAAVTFCSFSVLYVLIRPGPGEGGRNGGRVDRSKLRAFITITVILVVLWLWLGGILVSYTLYGSYLVGMDVKCSLMTCVYVFNIPSSMVSPLLYLHRAGKLSCSWYSKG
ncbi:uncharacterized protein LOC122870239 isoform X1 [Xyrichtys novacula]|uniref:Uncharacterized protein LOC122870239 isoform X1 n=1 Tax=Xyrichtys novacula TaxID=13765 RepID=A0AAV1EHN1_XYRNO|nr:uncharacterized protein LOC122870239 isoform X1 [Xyrichtys novacula]